MTSEVSFRLYELFFPLVKEEAKAKAFVTNIEHIIEQRFEKEKDRIASKEDITHLRSEMKEDNANLKVEIAELKVEMKEQKADLLKWMIVLFAPFYIGMIVFLVKQFSH